MEAERFFNNFLTYEPLDIGGKTVEEIQSFVPFRCSEEERGRLIRVVSEEEVAVVVDGETTVRRAHAVAVAAEHALLHAVPRLTAALVHADPAPAPGEADPHEALAHHVGT